MRAPRRDVLLAAGNRAGRFLEDYQAAVAWRFLAVELRELGDRDLPKFRDLVRAIRRATIAAASVPMPRPEPSARRLRRLVPLGLSWEPCERCGRQHDPDEPCRSVPLPGRGGAS